MAHYLVDRKSILSAPDRIDLGFSLGKAFIDSGQPKQAMEHLIPANRLRRISYPTILMLSVAGWKIIARVLTRRLHNKGEHLCRTRKNLDQPQFSSSACPYSESS